MPVLAHAYHGLALIGFVCDSTRLAHAQANPTVPGVARTNPVWDWTGVANWEGYNNNDKQKPGTDLGTFY